VGEGELGDDGCAVFLSEPRFQDLPCVLETRGVDHSGPDRKQVERAMALRERGLAARRRG
jgi:deoxyribonuclease-4